MAPLLSGCGETSSGGGAGTGVGVGSACAQNQDCHIGLSCRAGTCERDADLGGDDGDDWGQKHGSTTGSGSTSGGATGAWSTSAASTASSTGDTGGWNCTPGERECVGNSVVTCLANGKDVRVDLCPQGSQCLAGECSCQAECNERVCGPDPRCGLNCGFCPTGNSCSNGQCLPDGCIPDCTTIACGPDPICGQNCGTCPGGQSCQAGSCVPTDCVPDCDGRSCGLDPVCGQSCGECPSDQSCIAGQCSCDPGQLSCSPDGCIDPSRDPDHCGGCNRACPPQANALRQCTNSACRYTCQNGFADCDGNPANGCEQAEATHRIDRGTLTQRLGAQFDSWLDFEVGHEFADVGTNSTINHVQVVMAIDASESVELTLRLRELGSGPGTIIAEAVRDVSDATATCSPISFELDAPVTVSGPLFASVSWNHEHEQTVNICVSKTEPAVATTIHAQFSNTSSSSGFADITEHSCCTDYQSMGIILRGGFCGADMGRFEAMPPRQVAPERAPAWFSRPAPDIDSRHR